MQTEVLKYPNFLIIGAGKSGTTSLYNYLKQHPEVYMSPVKEPDFFAVMGQKPVSKEDDPYEFYNYPWAVYTLEEYKKLFEGVTHEKAVGESSTMYLYKPNTHLRIKQYVPHAKMIAIFRNPAERLWSRWLHLAREDRLPTPNFEDVFDKGTIWWKRDDLVQEGFYYTHLKKYFDIFPREQFKIILYDELRKNQEQIIKELYEFLEIDPDFKPRTDVQYNVSGFVKNKWKDKIIGQQSIIRKAIESLSPGLVDKMRNSVTMQKWVTSMRAKNLVRPKLDPEIKNRLINEIYKDEILKLQDLIQKDLTHWLHN